MNSTSWPPAPGKTPGPEPFWENWSRLKDEYARRIPE
jgi:hypothetical protein